MNSEEKQALAEQAYEKAVKYELDYGCCPQCVLATVQETVGIVDDATIKASHGLSGGGGLVGARGLRRPDRRADGAQREIRA